MDRLEQCAARALGQGRAVRTLLDTVVLPALPPAGRGPASRLRRRIDRGEIFDEAFLEQLDAVTASLRRRVEDGTHRGWHSDEHHVDGGYVVTGRDGTASDLAAALPVLDALATAVAETLDAAKAAQAAADLASG